MKTKAKVTQSIPATTGVDQAEGLRQTPGGLAGISNFIAFAEHPEPDEITIGERAFMWRMTKRAVWPCLKCGTATNEMFQRAVLVVGYEPTPADCLTFLRHLLDEHKQNPLYADLDPYDRHWLYFCQIAGFVDAEATKSVLVTNLYTTTLAEQTKL